jgi:hypothetical protein
MSGKQDKKIRKLYNRDFRHRMDEAISDIHQELGRLVKPAPRFFPKRLWRRLGKIFLNLD